MKRKPAVRSAAFRPHGHVSSLRCFAGAAILAAAPYIGHAQVSDSNRFQPGAGHLDWPAWLGALHTIGFDGYLAAECRLDGDPVAAVRSIPGFLRRSGA